MTSSIKALASSLGITKSNTGSQRSNQGSSKTRNALSNIRNTATPARDRESLIANAIPYESIPIPPSSSLPYTDHFTFSPNAGDTSVSSLDRPIPGLNGREGVEATGENSTIRLITTPFVPNDASPPRLKPFQPEFDLVPPTPGREVGRWPVSPLPRRRQSVMPGGLPVDPVATAGTSTGGSGLYDRLRDQLDLPSPSQVLSPGRNEPFIFGSPNPRHSISNTDFQSAANSVLAEMNARLGLSGEKAVNFNLLANASGKTGAQHESTGREKKANDAKWRFDKAHEEQFAKMDSIASHYAARRVGKSSTEPSSTPEPEMVGRKRKSSVLESNAGGTPAKSASRPLPRPLPRPPLPQQQQTKAKALESKAKARPMFPGGFGDSEEEEEEERGGDREGERRASKKPRVSELPQSLAQVQSQSQSQPHPAVEVTTKRVSIAPDASNSMLVETPEEESQRKEREAIKRKLALNKAKRRSSMGRVSVGGGKAPLVPNQKKSRFGFLTSAAKSIVKSVWNRGAGAPAPSNPPALKQLSTSNSTSGKPPIPPRSGPALHVKKGSVGNGSGFLKPSSGLKQDGSTGTGARSRSPLPGMFTDTANTSRSGQSTGTSNSKSDSVNHKSKPSVSSLGTRLSAFTTGAANVSSVGTKSSLASNANSNSGSTSSKQRPSSTLYAPTASSLAKMKSSSLRVSMIPTPVKRVQVPVQSEKEGSSSHLPIPGQTQAQNQPQAQAQASPSKIPIAHNMLSPRPTITSIFSKPLVFPQNQGGQGEGRNPITGLLSPPPTATGSGSGSSSSGRHGDQGEEEKSLEDNEHSHSSNSGLGAGAPRIPKKPAALGSQRRPRISRSKVIARLDAQRAASGSSMVSVTSVASTTSSIQSGTARKFRARSSAGTGSGSGVRRSVGGAKRNDLEENIAASAKQRARKSEFARRKSAKTAVGGGMGAMEVDE